MASTGRVLSEAPVSAPSDEAASAAPPDNLGSPPNLTLAELATIFDDIAAADAIFICIDCEAWEHDAREVTEIGVAILDTRDIPARDFTSLDVQEASDLIDSKMKYAHYRPLEYALHINKKWVKGCADNFGFGPTTWIRVADAGQILQRIFRDPTKLSDAADFDLDIEQQARTLMFVGHGASDDIAFMKTLGFDMSEVQGLEAVVNTQRLVSWFHTGLEQLLGAAGIRPVNLHNGGNDAAYTLQVMVKAAIHELQSADSLGKLLQDVEGQKFATTDLQHWAPVLWAGSAVEGDEVKFAIDYKTAKDAAFRRRARAKKEKDAKREEKRAAFVAAKESGQKITPELRKG